MGSLAEHERDDDAPESCDTDDGDARARRGGSRPARIERAVNEPPERRGGPDAGR